MPQDVDFPYPQTPAEIPTGYTEYSADYRARQRTLLVWSWMVLVLYFAMLLVAITAVVLGVWLGFKRFGACAGVPIVLASASVLAYLVKILFVRSSNEQGDLSVEITEKEHPRLFAFVAKLSGEIGVAPPTKILVQPEPNAGAKPSYGLANLFVEPRSELMLGIGLINAVNLSELKAVLAHELGHFAQHGRGNTYAIRMAIIVENLLFGHDGFERAIRSWKAAGNPVGFVLFALTWIIKAPLLAVYSFFGEAYHAIRREGEFHADRVGASCAGSNAMVHGLYRVQFAAETYNHALNDLLKVMDDKLYTADIYYHQHAAGDIIRRRKRDPDYGLPPRYLDPIEGKKIQIFDADGAGDHPADDYHPSDHEREEHVKSPFVAAEIDERSAWVLFDDAVELREKMTYKMYRANGFIKKGKALDDPREVQKFLEEEHLETTYDERYKGAYDDRLLNPGPLDELDALIAEEPWEDARLAIVYSKLYEGLEAKVEARQDTLEELAKVRNQSDGARSRKIKKLIKDLEADLEDNDDWFRTLDRRVYLVCLQMSYRVRTELYTELFNRYRFHMVLQGIYRTAKDQHDQCEFYLLALRHMPDDTPRSVREAFSGELFVALRASRKALRDVLAETKDIDMPAMKHFDEGENLAEYLLSDDLIRPPGENSVSGKWLDKLFKQMNEMSGKSARLHFKSLGQILALQERIAAQFLVAKGL